jgi:hypothetical protein
MKSWTYWIVVFLVGSILLHVCLVVALQVYYRPSEYRFPFPAEKALTQQEAIELSRRALILDGKRSDTMHVLSSGHQDAEGHDVLFGRDRDNLDRGAIRWSLGPPDLARKYSVVVTRHGNEIICLIYKPL